MYVCSKYTGRKWATFAYVWGKILDLRMHKIYFKSPTSDKAWNQFLYLPLLTKPPVI